MSPSSRPLFLPLLPFLLHPNTPTDLTHPGNPHCPPTHLHHPQLLAPGELAPDLHTNHLVGVPLPSPPCVVIMSPSSCPLSLHLPPPPTYTPPLVSHPVTTHCPPTHLHHQPQLLAQGELAPGLHIDEFVARREVLARCLPRNALAILPAAATSYITGEGVLGVLGWLVGWSGWGRPAVQCCGHLLWELDISYCSPGSCTQLLHHMLTYIDIQ